MRRASWREGRANALKLVLRLYYSTCSVTKDSASDLQYVIIEAARSRRNQVESVSNVEDQADARRRSRKNCIRYLTSDTCERKDVRNYDVPKMKLKDG